MSEQKKNICICAGVILTNFVLFLTKLYIALYIGSICIYTDAVNNLMDSLTSIIAMVGFMFLLRAKNTRYPFGYGRIQDLVSFIMSAVVIAAGFSFAYSALERVFYPTPVAYTASYAIALALTAAVKLTVSALLHFYIKKHPSPVLSDMRLDSILDFFISAGTVVSFTVSAYAGIALDGVMGLVVSVLIIISGIKILIPAVRILLGRRDDRLCDSAEEFITSLGCSVSDVQCHQYGNENVFTACTDNLNDAQTVINEFRNKFGCELFITSKEKKHD